MIQYKYSIRNILKIEHATLYMGGWPLNIVINKPCVSKKKGSAPATMSWRASVFLDFTAFLLLFLLYSRQKNKVHEGKEYLLQITFTDQNR